MELTGMTVCNKTSQSKIEVLEGCSNPRRRPHSADEPLIPPGKNMPISNLQDCTFIKIDQNPDQNWYIKLVNPCHYELIVNSEICITGIEHKDPPGKDPYLIIRFAPTNTTWTLKIENPGGVTIAQPSNVTIGEDRNTLKTSTINKQGEGIAFGGDFG